MLQKEFEERIAREASVMEYERANALYMLTSIDKDTFCAEWEKGVKDSRVTADLAAALKDSSVVYSLSKARNAALEKELREAEGATREAQGNVRNLAERVSELERTAETDAATIAGLRDEMAALRREKDVLYSLLERLTK